MENKRVLASFMITFREGLEAFLIIGIILAYLAQTRRTQLNKHVYAGTGLGLVASFIAAAIFTILAIEFEGPREEIFEGVVMLFAAAILTSMIIWMTRESSNISSSIRQKVDDNKAYGLLALAFLSVFREGIETTLFLGAAAMRNGANDVLYGGLAGIFASLVVAYAVFRYSAHTDIHKFFKVTSIFLIVFAAGLTAHGVHELQEGSVIPTINEHVWDMNHILDENTTAGSLMKSLFGYNGNPSLLEVISYAGYYIAVVVGLRIPKKQSSVMVTT